MPKADPRCAPLPAMQFAIVGSTSPEDMELVHSIECTLSALREAIHEATNAGIRVNIYGDGTYLDIYIKRHENPYDG